MTELFFNEYGRLRSGWRFAFFIILFLFLTTLLTIGVYGILTLISGSLDQNGLFTTVIGSIIPLIAAITVGWFCGKFLENLPFRALGAWFTKFWFKDLILGFLIGAVSIGFAALIAMIFGGLRFTYNEEAGSSAILITLGASFLVFFFAAAFEEALFRGYILQTFARANLAWMAILLTSVLFASAHLGNPSAGVIPAINTALAGIWLGVAYLKTRTLWLVFGVHFAWNWVMGAFLGIEVSGLTGITSAPILKEIDTGPLWITGGDYGLEGGIACTIALVASTLLIWYLPILKPMEEMVELTSKETPNENFLAHYETKTDANSIDLK